MVAVTDKAQNTILDDVTSMNDSPKRPRPLGAMMSIADASLLLDIPESSMYERVRKGTDGLGGRHFGRTPRVRTHAVLEVCGIDRKDAVQILADFHAYERGGE